MPGGVDSARVPAEIAVDSPRRRYDFAVAITTI